MAKVYTDEEMQVYSKNPNVLFICRNRLSLTLEFRRKLYDAWLEVPSASTIRKILIANGFDISSIGQDFYKDIAKGFKRSGPPKFSQLPSVGDDDVVFGINYNKGTCFSSTSYISPVEVKDNHNQLLESGRFVLSGSDIWFSPEFEKELFATYPDITIQQGIKNAGIDINVVGYKLICKLERKFKAINELLKYGSAYTDLIKNDQDVSGGELILNNPFILDFKDGEILLHQKFYQGAISIKDLPIDEILDVFMIDHSLLTFKEKAQVLEKIYSTEPARFLDIFTEGTNFEALVLRKRELALIKLADAGFDSTTRKYQSFNHLQKKRLCQWIESLPKDPGHIYTKAEILRRIGISKSVYYLYVNKPGFGLGEVRKEEADKQDAELIRKVMEYKGFRKGSRQIYMLLPRLTGKIMSLKKIRRLMKRYGIHAGIREANEAKRQAKEQLSETVRPNILKRRFRLYRPNEVRVTDVTYLDYGDKVRAYGSALMDPVTGRLLAFVISANNDLEIALETLRAADNHPCQDGGIFHSDQGSLYRTKSFQKELLERGLTQSMSKKGNCWDNSTQESFFGHFKDECNYAACKDINELQERVAEYVYYYNNERGLWERGRKTPVEYEEYLLSLNDEEFGRYLAQEEARYDEMKKRASELAKKRYGTLGV